MATLSNDIKVADLTQTEVKDFLNTWARAYDAGSPMFFECFAPNASIFTLSSPTRIDGREEFKRGFEPYLESGVRRSQILSPSIDVHGTMAVATFHNRVSVDNVVTNTRATVVIEKGADGMLQITHLHQSPLGTPGVSHAAAIAPGAVSLLEERVATAAAVVGTPK